MSGGIFFTHVSAEIRKMLGQEDAQPLFPEPDIIWHQGIHELEFERT